MRSRSVLLSAIVSICLTSAPVLAQQLELPATASNPADQPAAARQSALSLLEETLASTGSLILPSNRLVIELRAFPIVWSRGADRARALVQQMAAEFAQVAAASAQDPDRYPLYALNDLRNQRNLIARTIASSDPEMALLFLSATLPYLESMCTDDDCEDHELVVEFAAQVALHNPQRALQLAEQQLTETGDLPPSMINLLDQVRHNNAEVGARLFREILDHLRQQNLAEDTEALSFAAALLSSEFSHQAETGKPDDSLRALAEAIAAAALGSDVLQRQPEILSDALTALDALVPSKTEALRSKCRRSAQAASIEPSFWQKFNQARSSGDSKQVLGLLSQAPEEVRTQALQQAAGDFANNGDLEQTRQLAERLEPWQRNNVLQTAIRAAALAAASRADFPRAHQLAAQVTDEDSRATLLSELAIFANGDAKPHLAEDLLGEATSLVVNRSASTSAFAAQLSVAKAYLRVKPELAIPLLERSASQIEQALSAAARLDGFLPESPFFRGQRADSQSGLPL